MSRPGIAFPSHDSQHIPRLIYVNQESSKEKSTIYCPVESLPHPFMAGHAVVTTMSSLVIIAPFDDHVRDLNPLSGHGRRQHLSEVYDTDDSVSIISNPEG